MQCAAVDRAQEVRGWVGRVARSAAGFCWRHRLLAGTESRRAAVAAPPRATHLVEFCVQHQVLPAEPLAQPLVTLQHGLGKLLVEAPPVVQPDLTVLLGAAVKRLHRVPHSPQGAHGQLQQQAPVHAGQARGSRSRHTCGLGANVGVRVWCARDRRKPHAVV